jgi:Cysteine-rich CPXCG
MKPRRRPPGNPARDAARQAASLDPAAIDTLYGLEPVYEPAEVASLDGALVFTDVQCPYCGEWFETRLDLSEGDSRYVEDCQVCCKPIDFNVEVGTDGVLAGVTTQRLD